jgi:predicted CXXCH cytochrome family protein
MAQMPQIVLSALLGLCLLPGRVAAQDRVLPDAAFKDSVHAVAGLECVSCHKGQAAGTYTAIARGSIAATCASCHSDAAYMRKFDPQVRVDQFSQYLTSAHGRGMQKGETRVATCSDCHSSHGVVRVRDSRSPVAPLNVAKTCSQCHGDAERMKAFGHDAQVFTDWSSSVHANALLKRGDASAPTCNTCHGSHGATPPGVTEVANVCAQCHVREAENFKTGPKQAIFDGMGQAECLVCHGNHAIQPPTHAMIGLTEGAVCATCHDSASSGVATIKRFRDGLEGLTAAMTSAKTVVDRAEHAGMLVEDGRLALREATEQYVQARVAMHTFTDEPFVETSATGLAAAARAEQAGNGALEELQDRRRGLAVATLLIVGFLITLWMKIRRLPAPSTFTDN